MTQLRPVGHEEQHGVGDVVRADRRAPAEGCRPRRVPRAGSPSTPASPRRPGWAGPFRGAHGVNPQHPDRGRSAGQSPAVALQGAAFARLVVQERWRTGGGTDSASRGHVHDRPRNAVPASPGAGNGSHSRTSRQEVQTPARPATPSSGMARARTSSSGRPTHVVDQDVHPAELLPCAAAASAPVRRPASARRPPRRRPPPAALLAADLAVVSTSAPASRSCRTTAAPDSAGTARDQCPLSRELSRIRSVLDRGHATDATCAQENEAKTKEQQGP